jgi:NADH dehydrogenase (ubiquinone) flavoprotein 2
MLSLRACTSLIQTRAFTVTKIVNHVVDEQNTEENYFEFTEQNYKEIAHILSKYPSNCKRSGTIPLLMLAQKQNNNFLSLAAMNKVAKILEIPPLQAYEVASFYAMFNRTPIGKYHIQVCGTTPCMLRGVY